MSCDFAVWKRSPATKTAMVKEVHDAIGQDRSHPAMARFDPKNFESCLRSEFAAELMDGLLPFEFESCDFTGETGNWFNVHLGYGKLAEHTKLLVHAAVECGLMVYDPQRGVVYGNSRPKR
jgi:hypothetical protein